MTLKTCNRLNLRFKSIQSLQEPIHWWNSVWWWWWWWHGGLPSCIGTEKFWVRFLQRRTFFHFTRMSFYFCSVREKELGENALALLLRHYQAYATQNGDKTLCFNESFKLGFYSTEKCFLLEFILRRCVAKNIRLPKWFNRWQWRIHWQHCQVMLHC